MTHLESIQLINFQCHKDTTISFVEGVNAIVGSSDSGKSAILRGLYWVLFNKPSGKDFMSHWGGDTRVITKWSNGVQISRYRTGSSNGYELIVNGKKNVFEAIGFDVPEEIKDAIPFNIINWQGQLEKPYLLGDSASEVAKTLNTVADLSDIDVAASRANALIRDTKATIKLHEQTIDKMDLQLEKYKDLDSMFESLQYVEERNDRKLKLEKDIESLKTQIAKIVGLEELLATASIVTLEPEVKEAFALFASLRKQAEQIRILRDILVKSNGANQSIDKSNGVLLLETSLDELRDTIVSNSHIANQCSKLKALLLNLDHNSKQKDLAEQQILTLTAEKDEIMPDICPFCNSRRTK